MFRPKHAALLATAAVTMAIGGVGVAIAASGGSSKSSGAGKTATTTSTTTTPRTGSSHCDHNNSSGT